MAGTLRLGEILVEANVLTPENLENALALQKKRQLRLGTILLQEDFVSEPQLVQALSRRLSIPWVSLWHIDIPDELLDLVPASVAEEFFLIPIYIRTTGSGEKALYVAMNDPTDDAALRFVSASSGMTVKPMIAGPSDISAAIRVYYYGEEELSEEPPFPGSSNSSIPPPPPQPGVRAQAAPPPAPPTAREGSLSPPPPPSMTAVPEQEPEEEIDTLDTQDLTSLPPDVLEPLDEDDDEAVEEPLESTPPEEALAALENVEDEKQRAQREVEKHMFGVGRNKKPGGISLTLLDGTMIAFGGAAQKKPSADSFTREDLIAGLRAAADNTPMDDFLPSDRWEHYTAALLEILFRKHLVFFDEFVEELKKQKKD